MDFLYKLILITILVIFIINMLILSTKYLLLNILEDKENIDIYNKIATKNYLKNLNKDEVNNDEIYKLALEKFNKKEEEICQYISNEKCLEKIKLEDELYEHYMKYKTL